jgi:hypothetical protein
MCEDVLTDLAQVPDQIYERFFLKYLFHMLELHNIVLEIYNIMLE